MSGGFLKVMGLNCLDGFIVNGSIFGAVKWRFFMTHAVHLIRIYLDL